MELLRKLEGFLEGLLRSLAGPGVQRSVQPVEIGKQLGKAMLADRRVSTVHVYVPNQFTVHVNPQDWEKLQPISLTITTDLGEYLATRARRSGVNFVAPVQIEFQSEESVPPGSVRVVATFQETEGDVKTGTWRDGNKQDMSSDGGSNSINGTQVYKMSPAVSRSDARAALIAIDGSHEGQRWALDRDPVSIGRSVDQYVRLRDPSISRNHAVIKLNRGHYWIEDNNSTNGVRVNNEFAKKAMLADGDIIQLGTIRLQFRVVE